MNIDRINQIADAVKSAFTPDVGTVYISGPMTGIQDFNYPAFNALAANLRLHGFTVLNPAETDGGSTHQSWSFYIRHDIEMLLKSRLIVLLPGWENSQGARLETDIGKALDLQIFDPAKSGAITNA